MSLDWAGSLSYVTVLMEGVVFGESPRWHDGRVWFSDWGAHQVIALDPNGGHEVMVHVASFPMCIDFLPDGRLLVVDSAQRRLLRREPDGSMVTHASLAAISEKPWNDIVVDARAATRTSTISASTSPAVSRHQASSSSSLRREPRAWSPMTSHSPTAWPSPRTVPR